MRNIRAKIIVRREVSKAVQFLRKPQNMCLWTSHQSIHSINGRWVDVRATNFVEFRVTFDRTKSEILYCWSYNGKRRDAIIRVRADSIGRSAIEILLVTQEKVACKILSLLRKELKVLKSHLEGRKYSGLEEDQEYVRRHHLHVFQRKL